MKYKVLLTEEIRPVGLAALEKEAIVVIAPDPKPETIANMISDFDGLIARNTHIGEDVFANAPKLKAVASHGVGTDHIDLNAASQHGVCVVNTPGANSESVAEFIIGLMLSLSRKIIDGDYAMRIQKDYYQRNQLIGRGLNKKTIAIVGMGQIGRRLAKICSSGFNMKVLGYDPYLNASEIADCNAIKIEEIDDLIKEADFVSLNCPYVESLNHLIDERRLKLMKPTAFLINCARGQLVDGKALYQALKDKTIAGAAIDVYEQEPPAIDDPLFTLANLIATPHIAANAEDSIDNLSLISALDVLHVLKSQPEKANIVNKDAIK